MGKFTRNKPELIYIKDDQDLINQIQKYVTETGDHIFSADDPQQYLVGFQCEKIHKRWVIRLVDIKNWQVGRAFSHLLNTVRGRVWVARSLSHQHGWDTISIEKCKLCHDLYIVDTIMFS
jgi:hypothetical protein